jgi:hypothetical protein
MVSFFCVDLGRVHIKPSGFLLCLVKGGGERERGGGERERRREKGGENAR